MRHKENFINKKCLNCGKIVPENTNICDNCGSIKFELLQEKKESKKIKTHSEKEEVRIENQNVIEEIEENNVELEKQANIPEEKIEEKPKKNKK